MIFLLNILVIVSFAFYAGMYCMQNSKSALIWAQGIFIPFFVTIIISLIYQAPWFWYPIQIILQLIAFGLGIYFQKRFQTSNDK